MVMYKYAYILYVYAARISAEARSNASPFDPRLGFLTKSGSAFLASQPAVVVAPTPRLSHDLPRPRPARECGDDEVIMPHYRTRRLAGLVYLGDFKGHEYSPRQCPRSCGGPHYFITLICFLFISVLGTGPRGRNGGRRASRGRREVERARRAGEKRSTRGEGNGALKRSSRGGRRWEGTGKSEAGRRASGYAVQPSAGVSARGMRRQSVAGTPSSRTQGLRRETWFDNLMSSFLLTSSAEESLQPCFTTGQD